MHTCAAELSYWPLKMHRALQEAAEGGSCADLEYEGDLQGGTLQLRKCCASFPASVCNPTAKKMTPCKDEADFLPGNFLHEWCEFHGTVPETCATTKGCHAGEGWCHCDNSEACTAAGGAWNQRTCDAAVQEWDSEKHLAVQSAATGSCEDVDWHGQPMSVALQHESSRCCASYPASVCDPTAKKMTPCKDEADFMPSNVLHEWCEVNPIPNDAISWSSRKCCSSYPANACYKGLKKMTPCKDEADFLPGNILEEWCKFHGTVPETCATTKGCHAGEGWCYCDNHEACTALGGALNQQTCDMGVQEWEPAKHKALQEAYENGACGVDSKYGDLVMMIDHPARQCCASFPASVCNPTAKKMTPCKDEADFIPTNVLHEWCEVNPSPNASTCASHGCHGDGSYCHCSSHSSCASLGGSWKTSTCAEDLGHKDVAWHQAVAQASDEGTCAESRVHDSTVEDAISWSSRKCCSSYPANACYKGLKKMTPCKDEDEADFMPSNVVHEYCELHGVSVDSDTCTAHGCRSNHGHCHCDSQPGCEGVGGTWKVTSCEMEIGYWEPAKHKALQEAEESGTCGVDNMYGDLAIMIDHAATKCCASFPATLCDKTARHMTPCKDDADYTPEKEMYAWCDFYGDGAVLPEETVCNAQEGCYGGQGWCHCDGATGCQATGGIWNAHTCAKEVSQWSPEQHKMLQKADEHGTCLDLEVHGMRAQDFVNWPAQQCCKSFPASICDKDVKAMTPCLRSQDFDHNKTMWAWCEGLYPVPAEADCLAQGCTGNEHHCHCETAAACTALGGKYVEHQCWQDLQWMAAEVHKGIAKAIGQGTCEDVEAQHGKLEYAVDWLGILIGCFESLKTADAALTEDGLEVEHVFSSSSAAGLCKGLRALRCGYSLKAKDVAILVDGFLECLLTDFGVIRTPPVFCGPLFVSAVRDDGVHVQGHAYRHFQQPGDLVFGDIPIVSLNQAALHADAILIPGKTGEARFELDPGAVGVLDAEVKKPELWELCSFRSCKLLAVEAQAPEWGKEPTLLVLNYDAAVAATTIADVGPGPEETNSQFYLTGLYVRARADAESLYGTAGAPLCKDAADFLPEREMWAWCDFYAPGASMPDDTTCNGHEGCYGGQGWCHCEGKTGCQGVGGIWNAQTCAMEVDKFSPEQQQMLREADLQGNCLDLEANGMKAQDLVSWPAQTCCHSFPASVCNKELEAQTPCLQDEDFEHNKSMWAWCDTYIAAPSQEGCHGDEWHCHCETQAGCLGVGGRWEEYQCWQDLKWMSAEVHEDGVWGHPDDLSASIRIGRRRRGSLAQPVGVQCGLAWLGARLCNTL
ncbi:unnamed protein product [Symbiodinium microadriaticum]|nr:unnamed protein product [Symbiodinium microadriaticum]